MSELRVGIAAGPIEGVAADVAVVAFFSDERPLRGDAGRADWRLCGALSRLIQRGKLSGAWGEAALVPSTGGLRAHWVLAQGLGPRGDFDARRRAESTHRSVARALDLGAGVLALRLPPACPGDSDFEQRLDLLLEALGEAAALAPAQIRIRLVPSPEEHAFLTEGLTLRARGPVSRGLVFELSEARSPRGAKPPAGASLRAAAEPGLAGLRVK